jgi:mono/diheme cytochrome c family protein
MRGFIIGLIVGVVLLPLVAFCYIYFGFAPVATAAPPFPLERKITSVALNARISREAPRQAALPVNEGNLMEGAKVYQQYCAMCHGLPGGPETIVAKGMFPRPPQFLKGQGGTNKPPGDTFWKVKNGIRLTGMPAYGKSLSETQLWQVSLFLANTENLPGSVAGYLVEAQ